MSDLFVSYKREDQGAAKQFVDALERRGWTVWWDRMLTSGVVFDDAIDAAVGRAKCVIVLWSEASVKSDYVRHEARLAYERDKLLPVAIDGVDLPTPFHALHTERLLGWEDLESDPVFQKLLRDIAHAAGPPPAEAVERARLREEAEAERRAWATNEEAVLSLLTGPDVVPFLGWGVHESGPVSVPRLSEALLQGVPGRGPQTLARAAQCAESWFGSRERLQDRLREILGDPSSSADPLPVHDLLLRMENLSVVVSMTIDRALEQRLRDAGRRFTVVSHILRSYDGLHEGKLLVVRPGAEVKICAPEEFSRRDAGLIVYKPLGSLLPDEGIDEDLEIDTIVITEADHLRLMGLLTRTYTGVPPAVAIKIKRGGHLFLGCNLDDVQMRQALERLRPIGTRRRGWVGASVRLPATEDEDVEWRRLGVDLIRMTPAAFAVRSLGLLGR